ncbi:MAG: hypothetical protein Tsb009_23180 [Planctomycetaceae bacterium]
MSDSFLRNQSLLEETDESIPLKTSLGIYPWLVFLAILLLIIAVGLMLWVPKLQRQRAISRVEKMGGIVYRKLDGADQFWSLLGFEETDAYAIEFTATELEDEELEVLSNFPELRVLTLYGPKLTDSGIQQLQQFHNLEHLVLVNCPGVSDRSIQSLKTSISGLRVSRRGPAMLGVVGHTNPEGCLILDVRAGTAAQRAGMLRGDIVTTFAGKPVFDFKGLADLISEYQPGEKVSLTILRQGKQIELIVELGAWKVDFR